MDYKITHGSDTLESSVRVCVRQKKTIYKKIYRQNMSGTTTRTGFKDDTSRVELLPTKQHGSGSGSGKGHHKQTVARVESRAARHKNVSHQVGLLSGEKTREGDWLYRPFTALSAKYYWRTMAIQGLVTVGAAWFLTMVSLVASASFGDPSTIGLPRLGLAAIQIAFIHYALYAAIYRIRVPAFFLPHLNPYVTLAEMVHFQTGLIPGLVQLFSQAIGCVIGSAIVFGVVSTTANPLKNVGLSAQLFGTSSGWGLFIQIMASAFWTWYYFHNYNHRVRDDIGAKDREIYSDHANARRIASNLGLVQAGIMALTFPLFGTTIQSPWRFLSGCVLVGTCGTSGAWVIYVGPIFGTLVGYLAHLATWSLTGMNGKTKFE